MFSSILPNASSSAKFVQNGPPKTPSRFSVRVFRTPAASAFPYPMAAKVDLGYRSVQQPEQQRYIPSNHNISYDTRLRSNNYAIYPGTLNDTYIYEQSTCSKSDIFSNSEYDAMSAATFSPAMSTDSTLTLRSPVTPERFLEERVRRPNTPAATSKYTPHGSMASQPPAMSRTTSNHHAHESPVDTLNDPRSRVTSMQGHSTIPIRVPISSASLNELTTSITPNYNGQLPSHIPEYASSSFSELEVDERDRIAKINAEFNAVSSSSSSSYYSNNNAAVAIESNFRRMSISPPDQPSLDTFTRVASSQPLHQNLHFPTNSDDFNHTSNPNSHPSIFSTKDGSPPLVERVPSRVEFPSVDTQSGQFLPAQPQGGWNRDGAYHSDHSRVSPYLPPPPTMSNHPFDNGSVSLSRSIPTTYAASQETTNSNEYRPLPVPPLEAPRQRGTSERRPSVAGPRPDVNVLKSTPSVRHQSQTARESYDHPEMRREVSNSPPREGSTLQPSSRELPSRAAMAVEMRRDTRTPAPRESNDYRPAPPTRHDSYVTDGQKPPVEPRSGVPHPSDARDIYKQPSLTPSPPQLHLSPSELEASRQPSRSHPPPPAVFAGSTETERFNSRIRNRSISFSSSTRPSLTAVNNPGQHLSSSQQHQTPTAPMSNPRRVSEQVRTSPPSRMQEPSVYHTDYVEPDRRNDVRSSGPQAMYNSQPTTPNVNRDAHPGQRQNPPIGQPSSNSSDRAPSYPTINSRNATQEVPNSRSRTSYVELPATHTNNGFPARGATPYDKSSVGVKAGSTGGYSSSSNSTDHGWVPPEQPSQRRYSDGDQNPPPRPVEPSGRNSAPLVRSVRWTENLICPSPVFASQRRKGWFNRRGDQLWTNDGVYKPPSVGQEYPSEFDDYPEHGEGWMNEENIRIDMGHRLVPKPPLRSALKQTK